MTSKYTVAGLHSMWWSVISKANDSTKGFAIGQGTTLANGADSAFAQLLGIAALDLPLGDAPTATTRGDNTAQGKFIFAGDPPEGSMTQGTFSNDFAALAQGTKEVAYTTWRRLPMGYNSGSASQFVMIFNFNNISKDAANKGQAGFTQLIYYMTNAVPNMNNPSDQAEGEFPVSLISNNVTTIFTGETLTKAIEGQDEGAVAIQTSDFPITGHSYVGDGATLNFTLGQTPVAEDGDAVKLWEDGVLQDYPADYTVVASTKVLTFAVAPVADVVDIVLYEYDC